MNNKKKILYFIKISLFLCIVAFLFIYGGFILRPINTDSAKDTINTFHNLPEDSVEVIIYGSSRAWKGLDPIQMYEEYGIGAYNYGCNWQNLNTTELFFTDSLMTQSPKLALIETTRITKILEDVDVNGEIYYTKNIPDSSFKKEYIKQCFGDDKGRYLSYYFPILAFHSNWSGVTLESFKQDTNEYNFKQTMGYYGFDDIFEVNLPKTLETEQRELEDRTYEGLDYIVSLARENNIEILFYSTPWAGKNHYYDAIKEYANKNGYEFVDLLEHMEEMGIDSKTDFIDARHVNNSGTEKITKYMGRYISEHYELTDMRTVYNNLWEQ